MIQALYNGVKLYPCRPEPDLDNIERLDLGYLPLVHHFMRSGLQVDPTHFQAMEKILMDDMDSITEQVKAQTGHYLNLDSGDQVADLLFKKMGLKQAKKKMTPSGSRESVEDDVLTAIQHEHPVVGLIQDFKEYSKLLGTYARPLFKLSKHVNFTEWRVFPNLTVTRVPSGRSACKEPNLLAMPNRTTRGRQLCEGFITKEGWVYLSIDFSQIEPRTGAHRSGDKTLIRIYQNDEDIYSDFATAAFRLKDERWECKGFGSINARGKVCDNDEHVGHGWHYPTVDKKKHRFPAKTCTLASFYEVSGPGLLEQMPVVCKNCDLASVDHTCGKYVSLWNEDNCQGLIDNFGFKYPDIIATRMKDHAYARRKAYIVDDFGRVLHVAAVRSVLPWVVSAALREAGNLPLQGTARGLVKLAQTIVYDDFVQMGIIGDIVNPVLDIHDELLMEVREDMADEVAAHVIERFEGVAVLKVPIKASQVRAKSWGLLPK